MQLSSPFVPKPLLVAFVCVMMPLAVIAAPSRKAAVGAIPESTLFYGGFACSGADATSAARYPYFTMANAEEPDKSRMMDRVCREFFDSRGGKLNESVTLEFGLAGKRDRPLVFAVALSEELVLQEEIGGVHKTAVSLGFELLVLDFEVLEIVSTQPFFLELIDASAKKKSAEEIAALVRDMLDGGDSLFAKAASRFIANVRGVSRNRATLQVKSVSIGEKALPFLREEYKNNMPLYQEWAGQRFTADFGSGAQVAMLPYSKDKVNSAMSLRFGDASVLQFKIPEPSYAIDITVQGFKRVLAKETSIEKLWVFGAFAELSVSEPLSGKVFYKNAHKYGVSKTAPAAPPEIDEFPAFSDALRGCFEQMASAMTKTKDKQVKGIMQKCRL